VVISKTGKLLFVVNNAGNTISGYMISSTGMLNPLAGSPFAAGSNPFYATLSPSGKFLAVGNQGDNTVSVFNVRSGGTLSQVPGSPFATGSIPGGMAFSPNGKWLYVANEFNNTVSGYSVNGTTGALTPTPTPTTSTGTNPFGVAVGSDNATVEVASGPDGTVSVYNIDPAGDLTEKIPPHRLS
jgi:6-phosphogluconolactonase